MMKHAIFIPPFGALADPHRLVDVAVAAEAKGWAGVFLWDHVLRDEVAEVLDPWVAMAAMATATTTIRLGPLVTPPVRRRPIKLAREILTLDLLSRGRLTVGLGLGVDTSGELSRFGEITDPRTRGVILDESAVILAGLLEGETVSFFGDHHTVDSVTLCPRPAQRPRPPMWFASRGDAQKPVRRASRYEGLVPIEVDEAQFATCVDTVMAERGTLDGFDIAVGTKPGHEVPAFTKDVATWALHAFPAVVDQNELERVIEAGPQ